MESFSQNARCVKCGHDEIKLKYCKGGQETIKIPFARIQLKGICDGIKEEHFHRTCERCGFEWLEACLPVTNRCNAGAVQFDKKDPELVKELTNCVLSMGHLGECRFEAPPTFKQRSTNLAPEKK